MSKKQHALIVALVAVAFFAGQRFASIAPTAELNANPASQKVSTSVYYQVTYSDKSVRDVTVIPKSNRGIISVTRVAVYRASMPGYTTHSTGPTAVTELNPTRTVRASMRWDGRAWVIALDPEKYGLARDPAIDAKTLRKVGMQIMEIGFKLNKIDEALNNVADPAAPGKIRRAVTDARTAQTDAARKLFDLLSSPNVSENPVCRKHRNSRRNQAVLTTRAWFGGFAGYGGFCPKCGYKGLGIFAPGSAGAITQQPNPDYESDKPKVKIETQN